MQQQHSIRQVLIRPDNFILLTQILPHVQIKSYSESWQYIIFILLYQRIISEKSDNNVFLILFFKYLCYKSSSIQSLRYTMSLVIKEIELIPIFIVPVLSQDIVSGNWGNFHNLQIFVHLAIQLRKKNL